MSSTGRARWMLAAVFAVALAIHLPALGIGFYVDDHVHQLALEGRLPLKPWGLYDFGTVADWRTDEGLAAFPWWTSPEWKIRFFRPLASLLLALDHAVFGSNPVGYHATSLLWFAALLVATYAALRALGLTRGVATAAIALLGTSQATAFPVAWVANRNTVCAAAFTSAAVAAIAARERLGAVRSASLAFAAAVLSCLCKESGVVTFVLVGAYAYVADTTAPRAWARRVAIVAGLMALAHVVFLVAAGYGTRSEFYVTPWIEPLRYAEGLGLLGTVGLLALATPALSDLAFALPQTVPALVAASFVVIVPLLLWMRRRLRGDRVALFLGLWTILALVPEAGAPLSDRLLLGPGVPAAALLAMLLARTLPRAAGARRWERAAAWALVAGAAIEAFVTFAAVAHTRTSAESVRAKAISADVGAASLGTRHVLLLQADDPLVAFSMAGTWTFATRDLDVRFATLQMGRRPLRWTRDDERTMTFESLGAPFVRDPFEIVYRAPRGVPVEGALVTMPSFQLEVVETAPGGGVRRVRARWPEPPDDARFRFLVPRDGRLVHVPPPRIGESIELPEAPAAGLFAR
jgi:hypothetical protein